MSQPRLLGIPGDLAEDVGLAPALELVRWRGGRRLYVPKSAQPGHEIERRLGREAFAWLVERFGGHNGRTVPIPKCERALMLARDAEIVEKHENGASASELAEEYGLSQRAVNDAIRRGREAEYDPQGELFEQLRA